MNFTKESFVMKNATYNMILKLVAVMFFVIVQEAFAQEESERDITAKEVPQIVLQVFNQAYPSGSVKGYSEEIEDRQKFYEVSCTYEGRKIDAIYHPDGSVAAIEEVIPESQLQDPVKQGFAAEIKNGTINLVERIDKDGKLLYELKAVNNDNGEQSELVFSAEGKLVEKKVKKMKDKEGEEEAEEEAEEMHENASQEMTVPDAVKAAFKAKFQDAEEVEWGMESEKEYEAEFELNEVEMSANFDPIGKLLETETVISAKELPDPILDTLNKEFNGFKIKKVEKIEKTGKQALFEIKLNNKKSAFEVMMNNAGLILKKKYEK